MVLKLLKTIRKILTSIGLVISWLMTRITLIVLFYLIVTPIGILARIFGKRFLNTNFDRNAASYWVIREAAEFDKRSYENQF